MKATLEGNINYAANVVKLDRDFLQEANGLDRLVKFSVLGHTALVERHIEPGYYIVFLAGTRIDPEYASYNNLYRDSTLNKDKTKTGYLEKNGRIKAISLRKNYSNALVMPLDSIAYTKFNGDLPEVFDHIGKHKICEKHVIRVPKGSAPKSPRQRVVNEYFPEHYDTIQYWRAKSLLNEFDPIDVTAKLHGCFTADTKITMFDGSQKKISEIKPGEFVLGFENGEFVKSQVLNAFTTGKTDEWLKLRFDRKLVGDKAKVVCTPDHKFFTKNRGYVEAKELNEEDILVYERKNYPVIDQVKADVLVGLALGDGSFTRNGGQRGMSWSHRETDIDYMNYLRGLLGNLVIESEFKKAKSGYGTDMLRDSTKKHPYITSMSKQWDRKGGKTIPEHFKLSDLSVAIWYMDDGSLGHSEFQRDRANFATCRYSREECERIVKALKEWGMTDPRLYLSKECYYRIRLNTADAYVMFNKIKHLIPDSMLYKIPMELRDRVFDPPKTIDELGPTYVEASLISRESLDIGQRVKYDLETETSNFFAQHILVHNSSARFAHIIIPKKLSLWEKIKRILGYHVEEKETVFLSGSRRVIKDGITPGFYKHDIWTDWGSRIKPKIPVGYLVYGELTGWVNGSPIQQKYDYGCPPGESRFFVYRVAKIDGKDIEELNWADVKAFCRKHDLEHVPVLAESVPLDQLDSFVDDHMEKVYYDMGYDSPKPGHKVVDEGVVIRQNKVWLKAKCQSFLEYESGHADQLNIEDIESQ